jgi:hypothetical protein
MRPATPTMPRLQRRAPSSDVGRRSVPDGQPLQTPIHTHIRDRQELM